MPPTTPAPAVVVAPKVEVGLEPGDYVVAVGCCENAEERGCAASEHKVRRHDVPATRYPKEKQGQRDFILDELGAVESTTSQPLLRCLVVDHPLAATGGLDCVFADVFNAFRRGAYHVVRDVAAMGLLAGRSVLLCFAASDLSERFGAEQVLAAGRRVARAVEDAMFRAGRVVHTVVPDAARYGHIVRYGRTMQFYAWHVVRPPAGTRCPGFAEHTVLVEVPDETTSGDEEEDW